MLEHLVVADVALGVDADPRSCARLKRDKVLSLVPTRVVPWRR
jgi:hypothetical protein